MDEEKLFTAEYAPKAEERLYEFDEMSQDKILAAKEGGNIAKETRERLEKRTSQGVVTENNFLPKQFKEEIILPP